MCEHVFVPDNERVSLETAKRLGWYFCIRCGLKVPNDAVRYAPRKSFEEEKTMEQQKRRNIRHQPYRAENPKKPQESKAQIKTPLQPEPWTDEQGRDWIVYPDGSAERYKSFKPK